MKRKLISLLLALAMLCSLFVPALAADETPAYVIPDVKGKIVILHTNDVHGADVAVKGTSIGTAGVVQLKKDFEAAGAKKVLLLSDGDAIMGKPLVSADKGKSAIDFMNAAGYDAMSVGNHELDFGLENLKELVKLAKFPILDANMTTAADGKPVFNANKIFDVGGVKIGVFGLSTPETMTKADASKMPGVTFAQGEKLYAVAQAQVDELKAAGANLIVCLGHLGIDKESIPNRSIELCQKVNGIDLFIDGHSHSTTAQIIKEINNADKTNLLNGTRIVSTGTALANVGLVIYDPTTKTLTDSLISTKEYSKVDDAVAKVVNDRNTAVNEQYGSVKVGTSEIDLNGTPSGGNGTAVNTKAVIAFPAGDGLRMSETNLGDFSADAILWQARKVLGENQADLAITNGGGIRTTVGKGSISMLDLLTVYPFGNTVATIKVTGAQLLEALEASTQFTPVSASGGFPQVAGVKFAVETAVEYAKGDQYSGSTFYAPKNPGSRVTISEVNGKPFDINGTYIVATNDFTAKGGDTFGVFKRVGGWKDAGVTLENALINYTAEELGGVVTAAKYGKPAGRITITYKGIPAGAWYYSSAKYVMESGVMTSTGSGAGFNAAAPVTRGTVVQTFYNMENKPAATGSAFADAAGEWYASAANWAASQGIVQGDNKGNFNGGKIITRQELAIMLTNYMSVKKMTALKASLSKASDAADVASWAADGMGYAVGAGLIKGNKGAVNPTGTASRAELAQMLYNFSKLGSASAVGTITEIEKYGHVVLDITIADFQKIGFELGDTVNVVFDNGYEMKGIPFFNGYYVDKGAPMLRAYPGHTNIAVCINYGKLNEIAGVGVGNVAAITMAVKGGAKAAQELNSLSYTKVRADYASDEVFANFRPVVVGKIAPGAMYRSASPVNNENGRAAYSDKLIAAVNVKSVLNLADTEADIQKYIAAEGFNSPYYKSLYGAGSVIALGMSVDYSSATFAKTLVGGLAKLSEKKGPFLIHCTEGKDRAGFASALLEALMGATKDEIIADYMVSFANYYGVTKGSDSAKYDLIVKNNIEDMLRVIAGVEKTADLNGVNLQKGAEQYLTANGMTAQQISALKTAFSTPIAAKQAA